MHHLLYLASALIDLAVTEDEIILIHVVFEVEEQPGKHWYDRHYLTVNHAYQEDHERIALMVSHIKLVAVTKLRFEF